MTHRYTFTCTACGRTEKRQYEAPPCSECGVQMSNPPSKSPSAPRLEKDAMSTSRDAGAGCLGLRDDRRRKKGGWRQ